MQDKALSQRSQKIAERNVLIDNFKGILVLLYMADHIIIFIKKTFPTPVWASHSRGGTLFVAPWENLLPSFLPRWNYNPIDLGPILFFFMMGFVFFNSFAKKYDRIGRAAYKQVFTKNAAFMGFFLGAMVIGAYIEGSPNFWNTVPSIGFTALLAIPFLPLVKKNMWLKLVFGLAMLAVYFFKHDALYDLLASQPGSYAGGMAACVGYLGIMLLTGFIADVSKKGFVPYLILTVVFLILGYLVNSLQMPDFGELNATWMLSALSKINTIYFFFFVLDKLVLKNRAIPIIATLGRNIFLFLLVILITQMVFAAGILPELQTMTQVWLAVACGALVDIAIAIVLEKKKIAFTL